MYEDNIKVERRIMTVCGGDCFTTAFPSLSIDSMYALKNYRLKLGQAR